MQKLGQSNAAENSYFWFGVDVSISVEGRRLVFAFDGYEIGFGLGVKTSQCC